MHFPVYRPAIVTIVTFPYKQQILFTSLNMNENNLDIKAKHLQAGFAVQHSGLTICWSQKKNLVPKIFVVFYFGCSFILVVFHLI